MYSCKIVLDSISPWNNRLTTFEIQYPRFVHSEFMTHRMFSRNAASSRAIPIEKMIESVQNDPVMPVWWGKNQSGMQAREELTGDSLDEAKMCWLLARDRAVEEAKHLVTTGLHKQLVNRVLEPWMWITTLVTATEWENFFALRDHKDAQPELREIAHYMKEAYQANTPVRRKVGEWHLPLVDGYDLEYLGPWASRSPAVKKNLKLISDKTEWYVNESLTQISVGRCARVSYLTHEGKRDPQKDIELHDSLLKNGHMSPFEHAARVPMGLQEVGYEDPQAWSGNFKGWEQYRKMIPNENNFAKVVYYG